MEKKVSLTLTQGTYLKLSEYTKRYGVSVRYMIKVLLDDSIDNDRYPDIFNRSHKQTNDIVLHTNKDVSMKKEEYDSLLNSLETVQSMESSRIETKEPIKQESNKEPEGPVDNNDVDISDILGEE